VLVCVGEKGTRGFGSIPSGGKRPFLRNLETTGRQSDERSMAMGIPIEKDGRGAEEKDLSSEKTQSGID